MSVQLHTILNISQPGSGSGLHTSSDALHNLLPRPYLNGLQRRSETWNHLAGADILHSEFIMFFGGVRHALPILPNRSHTCWPFLCTTSSLIEK